MLQGLSKGDQPFVLARFTALKTPTTLLACGPSLLHSASPLPVLLPLHPRTRVRIAEQGLEHLLSPLMLSEPLGFLAMLLLERRAELVVTDSGGVQKEAFLQGTPCVTVRSETEWVELLDCGWNRLCDPADSAAIHTAMFRQLELNASQPRPALYGDGYAAEAIVSRLQEI